MANEFDWTIMVYMAGDNNLSENMAFSLNELYSAIDLGKRIDTTKASLKVLACFDSSSITAPTRYIDFSELDANGNPFIEDFPEINFASATSIEKFAKWCIETRGKTAANYAMIFSGHSEAFKDTTFLQDESSNKNLTLFMFRYAMEQLRDKYFGGNKLAILGFDSCVMSMLEVGYELKDVAHILIASEGSLPNSGWGYSALLAETIALFPQLMTPGYVVEYAKGFVEAFVEHYKKVAIGGRSVDIAAWDLDEIEPLAESINLLGIELKNRLDLTDKIQNESITDDEIAVFQELKKILLQSHYNAQTYMREQNIDIKDFCKQLIFESGFLLNGKFKEVFKEIIRLCEEVIKNVDICVKKCGYVGEEYQFSNGISLYFPWTLLGYSITNFNYRYLIFNKGEDNREPENPKGVGKDWNTFLQTYLSRVTLRGTRKTANGRVAFIEDFNENNPVWSKDSPPFSKDSPPFSKDSPPFSKDSPPFSKDSPPFSKGELANSAFYFAKFKNFQMSWKISGYSDETEYRET